MAWWRRRRREDDLERELRDHLDLEELEQQAAGLSNEEARFAANRLFGNRTLVKEEVREMWGWMWLERFWQDLRYGGRGLCNSPVFTAVSVLSLALGIGATVTVCSVFEAVFFDAVTAKDVDRVKHIEIGGQRFSYREYEELSTSTPMLAGVAAYDQSSLSYRSANTFEKITGDIVSGNFFDVLGVAPFLGRTFTHEEGQARRERHVVILSHSFWERKLSADAGVLGREIELNREPFVVVGVLPSDYRSVHGYGITPDVYVPISTLVIGEIDNPGNTRLRLIARLKDGVSVSQAAASIHSAAQHWRRGYPGEPVTFDQVRLDALTGLEKMRNDGVPVELTLFFVFLIFAGGLILLIACANVGGLLLARGSNRSREIAIRLALGAPRHHLLQQFLTECFLLAFLGAGAGLALYMTASAGLDRIQIRLSFPLEVHLKLDTRALAFAIGLALIATLLTGLTPALQAIKRSWLLGSRQIGAHTRSRSSLRRMLVVGQFALAFVLLFSAALFLRSLARINTVDPGFDAKHVLAAEISLDAHSYSQKQAAQYFDRAITEIRRLPGVRSVSGAAMLPLGLEHWVISMKAGDRIIPRVHVNSVTASYFRTMGIRLLQGRDFVATDRADGVPVAIVNETFARKYLNDNAVNAQVLIPVPGSPPAFSGVRIVGVVADSKYGSLGEEPAPALYWPWSEQYRSFAIQINSVASSPGDLSTYSEALRRLDPHVPVKLQSMEERLATALLPSRIASTLLATLGSLGLLLAAVGIYGVMIYSVTSRTAEIGMRMAIGATRSRVLRMIFRDAFLLVSIGMALGVAIAMLVAQMLAGVLAAGVSAVDPLSFASVAVLLSAVAMIAALLPAWRASRVDPIIALRYE